MNDKRLTFKNNHERHLWTAVYARFAADAFMSSRFDAGTIADAAVLEMRAREAPASGLMEDEVSTG